MSINCPDDAKQKGEGDTPANVSGFPGKRAGKNGEEEVSKGKCTRGGRQALFDQREGGGSAQMRIPQKDRGEKRTRRSFGKKKNGHDSLQKGGGPCSVPQRGGGGGWQRRDGGKRGMGASGHLIRRPL